jgi:ATP-dependent DNA helicase RecQ
MLAGASRAILKGEMKLEIVVPPKTRKERRGEANPVNDPLFEALRSKRRELAETAGVPPYVIFHDATCANWPSVARKTSDFALISGVGARKLEAYGEAFLSVIREAAEG